MNLQWQKYNSQREDTVQKLMQEVTRLQKGATEKHAHAYHETELEMNKVLDEARRVSQELDDTKRTVTRLSGERDRVSAFKYFSTKLTIVFRNLVMRSRRSLAFVAGWKNRMTTQNRRKDER